MVTTALVLVSPQDSEPFHIEADSSDFASGAVLSQQLPGEEKWYPVVFYSKSLSPVEYNYEIHDKEMLTIIHALEEWRYFLEGAQYPVKVWTDYKNLEYFMTAKKLNYRQACWSLYLVCFDFKLIYCLGHYIGKPDMLSRRPDHGKRASSNKDVVLLQPELLVIRALKGVQMEGLEQDILREICQGNQRGVTNFIWPYLHQFSIDSHGLNGYGKPLKRPFDRYQSRLEAISNGRDIRKINW